MCDCVCVCVTPSVDGKSSASSFVGKQLMKMACLMQQQQHSVAQNSTRVAFLFLLSRWTDSKQLKWSIDVILGKPLGTVCCDAWSGMIASSVTNSIGRRRWQTCEHIVVCIMHGGRNVHIFAVYQTLSVFAKQAYLFRHIFHVIMTWSLIWRWKIEYFWCFISYAFHNDSE